MTSVFEAFNTVWDSITILNTPSGADLGLTLVVVFAAFAIAMALNKTVKGIVETLVLMIILFATFTWMPFPFLAIIIFVAFLVIFRNPITKILTGTGEVVGNMFKGIGKGIMKLGEIPYKENELNIPKIDLSGIEPIKRPSIPNWMKPKIYTKEELDQALLQEHLDELAKQ